MGPAPVQHGDSEIDLRHSSESWNLSSSGTAKGSEIPAFAGMTS
jgi:hypothetical protein